MGVRHYLASGRSFRDAEWELKEVKAIRVRDGNDEIGIQEF